MLAPTLLSNDDDLLITVLAVHVNDRAHLMGHR